MEVYPYGGEKTKEEMKEMSMKATKKNKAKAKREQSLKFDHLILDLNKAFRDLSKDASIQTLKKHLRILSILLIIISLLGLLMS